MKITYRQAEALCNLSCAPISDAHSVGALTPNGCKLYAKRRGCVVTYRLSGYASDGSDVRKDHALVAHI
jgi:hypothetical protein